jgi:hypothetical protein
VDESFAPDVESIYRMVALACASLVADKAKDHLEVMAIADSFLEYAEELAAIARACRGESG